MRERATGACTAPSPATRPRTRSPPTEGDELAPPAPDPHLPSAHQGVRSCLAARPGSTGGSGCAKHFSAPPAALDFIPSPLHLPQVTMNRCHDDGYWGSSIRLGVVALLEDCPPVGGAFGVWPRSHSRLFFKPTEEQKGEPTPADSGPQLGDVESQLRRRCLNRVWVVCGRQRQQERGPCRGARRDPAGHNRRAHHSLLGPNACARSATRSSCTVSSHGGLRACLKRRCSRLSGGLPRRSRDDSPLASKARSHGCVRCLL